MNVMFVSSEVYPFSKTGGLADVSESLPVALKKKGINVNVITPLYKSVNRKKFNISETGITFKVFIDYKWEEIKVFKTIHKNITIYFLLNDNYFKTEFFYQGKDVDIRFGLLCYSVLELCKNLRFIPDIFHLNDWQSGFVPVLLQTNYKNDTFFHGTGTLFTIHNLAYQGIFPENTLDRLSVTKAIFHIDGVEFYNQVNFLKGGLVFSNFINTVSPSYAKEIVTKEAGRGLHGILQKREKQLTGILNGIDYEEWNPEKDKVISFNYSHVNIDGKTANKTFLQKKLNFDTNENIPLFAFVGRLTEQKGVELLESVLKEMSLLKVQVVVLGTGEEHIKEKLLGISIGYRDKISLNFLFNENFAREIYAAADFLLMPSLYEPCGISQMIGMRYGVVPVVRKVGGLKDSVKEGVTGFMFDKFSSSEFLSAVMKALECYSNKEMFQTVRKNCMKEDFSWEKSSELYIKLYEKIKEE